MKTSSPLQHSLFWLGFYLLAFLIAFLGAPKAAHALRISPTASGIVVAVIDTGADLNHPRLKAHLWVNPGEVGIDLNGRNKSKNSIDDDGNGFVDDVHGWNFSDNNLELEDRVGHGTHIAGLIAEAQPAQIMVLKAFDPGRPGNDVLASTVKAIYYAIRMHAQIINYSGGGAQPSPEEEAAFKLAEKAGILVVAAAGNERQNADRFGFYPAGYNMPNMLTVAAVDQSGILLPSSNYGAKTISMAAPGSQVLSSIPQNQFGAMTGTSQATALVTKTAVLVYSQKEKMQLQRSPSAIIHRIVSTADRVQDLEGKLHHPVVLNTLRALQANDQQ